MNYTINTPITIDGKANHIRMHDGMTGIGSRKFWLNGSEMMYDIITQSSDITKGNHFLYLMKWRDNPWDKVYILISEEELPNLLSEENKWRDPVKVTIGN